MRDLVAGCCSKVGMGVGWYRSVWWSEAAWRPGPRRLLVDTCARRSLLYRHVLRSTTEHESQEPCEEDAGHAAAIIRPPCFDISALAALALAAERVASAAARELCPRILRLCRVCD